MVLSNNDKETLKALSILGYKYVAKDSNNSIFAFNKKPEKKDFQWDVDNLNTRYAELDNNVLLFLNWDDNEPFDIEKFFKEGDK